MVAQKSSLHQQNIANMPRVDSLPTPSIIIGHEILKFHNSLISSVLSKKTMNNNCFCYRVSFHVGLLFINFSSFKSDTENNANFDAVSSKHGNFDAVQ